MSALGQEAERCSCVDLDQSRSAGTETGDLEAARLVGKVGARGLPLLRLHIDLDQREANIANMRGPLIFRPLAFRAIAQWSVAA
jgi:hypothetical protein